ncbi:hypothetical protein H257_08242 [Aphanomyces astaci]|uniref:Uncharacterized protein n=1 Tax=Aphanomyces astaci TaxID=112090 RepID=W4GEC6_APHAT|nr:hypothetical protein H257_08242 [Aphanomyces astaci]ETV78025.1 hypothetical protein H257_08242 [Aphanomyces astaci]|eukprot:XP_009832362.1 hypothetical protein H257_08242 [Aphanomyces astaci]
MKQVACLLILRRRAQRRRQLAMLAYMAYHYAAYLLKSPKRVSALTGAMWVEEMLVGNADAFIEMFRMPRPSFIALLEELMRNGDLKATRAVTCQEQLCLFLYFVGHKPSSTNMQQRFQHSGETISRHLRRVVASLLAIAPRHIFLPPSIGPTPVEIATNSKLSPYFDDCRMAIDGTHVPVWVKAGESAPYHGRKGVTMNVLAACDFDMHFTYVLAGWEGSAGDGRVYTDALLRGLVLSPTKFDILDAGFALTKKCLTPYRSTRYHLKEYGQGRLKPQTKEELFNLRHAQLRNCIERIFGILKMRFPVLSCGVRYDYSFQVSLVMALCVVHNFIRRWGVRQDRFEQDADILRRQQQQEAVSDQNDPADHVEDADSDEAKLWRDSIAGTMWVNYQNLLNERRRRRS